MRYDDRMWLVVSTVAEDAGFNLVESRSLAEVGRCKVVPNQSASRRSVADGKAYYYSDTLYLRAPMLVPKEGDTAEIYDNTAKATYRATVDGVTVLPKKYVRVYFTREGAE